MFAQQIADCWLRIRSRSEKDALCLCHSFILGNHEISRFFSVIFRVFSLTDFFRSTRPRRRFGCTRLVSGFFIAVDYIRTTWSWCLKFCFAFKKTLDLSSCACTGNIRLLLLRTMRCYREAHVTHVSLKLSRFQHMFI